MAKKAESRRQKKIRKGLQKEFPGCWIKKIHGGWFQDAGIPDLLMCYRGFFFAFEVKEPDGEISEIQEENIDDILQAGGVALEIETLEEAINAVRKRLRQESKKSRQANYKT